MLGKLGIFITILVLVLLFYLVIAFGAGAFSKGKLKPETKKYLKSDNILLVIVSLVGSVLFFFFFYLEISDLHQSKTASL